MDPNHRHTVTYGYWVGPVETVMGNAYVVTIFCGVCNKPYRAMTDSQPKYNEDAEKILNQQQGGEHYDWQTLGKYDSTDPDEKVCRNKLMDLAKGS